MRKPKRQAVPDLVRDIAEFHRKFKQEYTGPPRSLPMLLGSFRKSRLHEEVWETEEAYSSDNLEKFLDGLVDTIYIALGTCHLSGFDFYEAWRRVHQANMAKELCSAKNPGKYDHKNDVVKPKGWTPPDLSDLVRGKRGK